MTTVRDATTVIRFVDLPAQYRTIGGEVRAAIDRVLEESEFILGRDVECFERNFAAFVGAAHGVGVSNGLDALRLALYAAGIGAGDEVIVPANTYIGTAFAVSSVSASPVLVDCEPRTYNIDVTRIEGALTPRTRAILPVHLTGQSADLDPILDIARRRSLSVIEDAAQAHGTTYKGRPCGAIGTIGCFSFYPGKNLGAYGDGGMVVTNDAEFAARVRRLRNWGEESKNRHLERGWNARLDTIHAAVLDVKLRYLARWNRARAEHAERYRTLLAGVGDLEFQGRADYSDHIYHLFVIETAQRDSLRAHLKSRGIETGIHYPTPIHLQPAYEDLGYRAGDFPCAERLAGRMLSLPMFAELTSDQIDRVADAVRCFYVRP